MTGLLGISTIGYGPDDNELAHNMSERISVEALERGIVAYGALVWAAATAESAPRVPA
jgi:acetylornithine deacetylase/succinyl-diaminopimelate desuccinylase-like protein